MTPFMVRVADMLGAEYTDDLELPSPALRPAKYRPVGKGNSIHHAYRGLTEQLVCEANALLADEDDHLNLVDDVIGDELMFSVYYRGRVAVVSTVFSDHKCYGRVVADGIDSTEPVELAGPEAVEDLLLLLLMESDVPRHPAH